MVVRMASSMSASMYASGQASLPQCSSWVNVTSVLLKHCCSANRMLLFCFCNTITVSVWFLFACVVITATAIVDESSWMHGHIFTLSFFAIASISWAGSCVLAELICMASLIVK